MILTLNPAKVHWMILINETDNPGITITRISDYLLVTIVCRSFEELEDRKKLVEHYLRKETINNTVTIR